LAIAISVIETRSPQRASEITSRLAARWLRRAKELRAKKHEATEKEKKKRIVEQGKTTIEAEGEKEEEREKCLPSGRRDASRIADSLRRWRLRSAMCAFFPFSTSLLFNG